MPALPAVPQVLRIDYLWTSSADADLISRSFWQYTSGPPTNSDCNAMAAYLTATTLPGVANRWHPDVASRGVTITDLTSSTAAQGESLVTTVGTRTGTELPAGTCALLNFTVARRYRGGKPRLYLPLGTSTDMATTQTWDSTLISNAESLWSDIAADIFAHFPGPTSIAQQVSVSYYEGFRAFTTPSGRVKNISTLRTGGPLVDPVTNFSCNPRFASQRRRNRP